MSRPSDGLLDAAVPAPRTPLAVVVIAYDTLERANRLLERLWTTDGPPSSVPVLVVLNPGPQTHADPTSLPPGVEVLALAANGGYPAAANAGACLVIERSEPDAIAVLTHDVELDLDALQHVTDLLEQRTSVGAAAPALYDRSTGEPWSFGGEVTRRGPSHRYTPGKGFSHEVAWIDGAALVVRTRALEGIGGFDERLFLYGEDFDVGLRLADAGWELEVLDQMRAWHDVGARQRPHVYRYLVHRNLLEVLRKNRGIGAAAVYELEALRDAARNRSVTRWRLHARAFADFVARRFGPPPEWIESDIEMTRSRSTGLPPNRALTTPDAAGAALGGDVRGYAPSMAEPNPRRDSKRSGAASVRRRAIVSTRTWLFRRCAGPRSIGLVGRLTGVGQRLLESRRVEVGSGPRPHLGYLHIDAAPDARFLHLRANAGRLPLPDRWANEVLAVHILEHVPAPALATTLEEWHRILAPGGIVEIHVPHGLSVAAQFAQNPPVPDQWRLINALYGYWAGPPASGPEAFTRLPDHKMLFSPQLLQAALEGAGFAEVQDITGTVDCVHREAWADTIPDFCLEMRASKP